MPPRPRLSRDLKDRVPVLFYNQHFSVNEICDILSVKKSFVYQTLRYFRQYGVSHNVNAGRGGWPRKLTTIDVKYINNMVKKRRSCFLDEIQHDLFEARGSVVSITTLYRTLQRLNYTRKRVSAIALERNNIRRSAFMNMIAEIVSDPHQLMFVDEAARNRKTSARAYGWSLRGMKCVQRRFFVRGERFSILPILTIEGVLNLHPHLPLY